MTPTVHRTRLGTTTTVDVAAVHETAGGADGRFRATIELPEAGYWSWSVSFPELMSDGVAFTLAVRTTDGLVPAPGSSEASVASAALLVAPAEQALPAIGVIALAVLAGGVAGFLMSWLAGGRRAPRESDVDAQPCVARSRPGVTCSWRSRANRDVRSARGATSTQRRSSASPSA